MSTIMETVFAKAKEEKKRIILPESTDERVLRAAQGITRQGLAQVFLIGDQPTIHKAAAECGVSLEGVEIRDPHHDHHME